MLSDFARRRSTRFGRKMQRLAPPRPARGMAPEREMDHYLRLPPRRLPRRQRTVRVSGASLADKHKV